MKLGVFIVYFICTGSVVTGQDTSTPLATTCCFKRTVGGVAYTLVKGNTIEGKGCLDDCVYARDDRPGSQFCFAKGNLMDKCLNSETEFQGVNVTSSKRAADNYTDWMSFNTTIGFINCTLKTVLPFVGPSQDVECSLTGLTPGELDSSTKPSTAGQEPVGDTNVPFTYSMLEGNIQRFSIFSEDCFIDCSWGNNILSRAKFQATIFPSVYWNTIFVEDAEPVVDMKECKDRCDKQKLCTFWTWSDLAQKGGRQKRNHNGISECGLRSYTANKLIPTAQGQFCGKKGELLSARRSGQVFVGNWFYEWSVPACRHKCSLDRYCNSWTLQLNYFSPPVCVLNYGLTDRKIKVCKYVTCPWFGPVVISGY